MTRFHRSISRFPTVSHFSTLRWLPVFAALAAATVPSSANAARASGAYNGTWNVVFATTRGNCSSGYSVPFLVAGTKVSSAGGGRVSGSVNRGGAVAVVGIREPLQRPHVLEDAGCSHTLA